MAISRAGFSRHRVPAEHRLLGLDRRTFVYAVPAVVVYLLWAWLVPWIDNQVPSDDPIRAGDVLQVTDRVTMTPSPGWGLVSGLRTSDKPRDGTVAMDQTILTKDGISFEVTQGPFKGSTRRLLRQIDRISTTTGDPAGFSVTGSPRPLTTDSGLRGLVEGFESQRNVGVSAAFVVDDTGIEVQVVGAPEAMKQRSSDIEDMLRSFTDTRRDDS